MPRKSAASKLVRKSAQEIRRASGADLDPLRAAMRGPILLDDIPERREFHRLQRDAAGRLPRRKSMIRDAVAGAMKQLHLTVYRLWKLAQVHYPPLSQAAVHEFLRGQRQLELPSIEALLKAVNLKVVKNGGPRTARNRRRETPGAKSTVR